MATLRITPPTAVELIPGDEVAELIAETDRRLASLEREVAAATGVADDAERRAAAEGVDGPTSTWAIVRLQRFLDDLREEAERDAQTVLNAARKGAQTRVEAARAGATQVRFESLTAAAPSYVERPVAPDGPTVRARVEYPPIAPTVAVQSSPPAAAPPPLAPAIESEPDAALAWAPIGIPPQGSTNGTSAHALPVPVEPIAAAPVVPEPVVAAPAVAAPVAAARVVIPAEPPAAPMIATPVPEPAAPIAAPARRRRFPLSAVLEVLAVLLVLLFILLRLS
jgi:hypothetical protein